MAAITNQQILAIGRGSRMYTTVGDVISNSSVRWSGVRSRDLLNPAGIDLTNPVALVYPYIPGAANPASQVFTRIVGTATVLHLSLNIQVPILYYGGDLNITSSITGFELDYHRTGIKLQKKLK